MLMRGQWDLSIACAVIKMQDAEFPMFETITDRIKDAMT